MAGVPISVNHELSPGKVWFPSPWPSDEGVFDGVLCSSVWYNSFMNPTALDLPRTGELADEEQSWRVDVGMLGIFSAYGEVLLQPS